jgi:hypothetical protein
VGEGNGFAATGVSDFGADGSSGASLRVGLALAGDFAAAFGRCAFNVFDAPRCDALAAGRFPAAAAGLAAFAGLLLAAGFALAFRGAERGVLRAAVLDGFLSVFFCVFFYVRLPLVAFDGSIIRLLQAMSWQARIA